MTIKGVVLDFDGTLVDSMPALTELGTDVISKHYGLSLIESMRRYLAHTGAPFFQQLELAFPNDHRNDMAAREFEERKPAVYDGIDTVEDVVEFLHDVAGFIRLGLVSSTSREVGERVFARLDLAHLFDGWWFNPTAHADAKELGLSTLVRLWELDPSEVLFVGDSARDEVYAQRAGTQFMRVAPGYHTFEDAGDLIFSAE